MSQRCHDMLKDAETVFKEKFENAYAAAKWIEKTKKPRISEEQGARSTAASSGAADGPPANNPP
eukprot:52068-Karenia_brevis.AAC.1